MEQALAAIHQANPDRLPVTLEFGIHQSRAGLFCRFPPELRAVLPAQLYAAYPDCRIESISEDAPAAGQGDRCWTVELQLRPDIFPMKRYPQFEDAINRTTADPLTALLSTLTPDRRHRLKTRIELSIRPARPR